MEDAEFVEVQQPVIRLSEQIGEISEWWSDAAARAESAVCTPETVKDVKKARAELRKTFESYEERRKAAKERYMESWSKAESVYKDNITEYFKAADSTYKDKIAAVELPKLAACEQRCREYFEEVCQVNGVEWLAYEQAGLKMTLTEAEKKTPKKYFDALREFVERVASDVDGLIAEGADGPELLAEYKANGLGVSVAQETVRNRRDAAQREAEYIRLRLERRKMAEEAERRVAAAAGIEMPVAEPESRMEEFTVTLRNVTVSELKELRGFLQEKGIGYV